jgi:cobalamin synthase
MAAEERTAEPLALSKAVFLPLVAAAFGAAGALLVLLLPHSAGATAAVIFWAAVTLARGERGIVRWFPKLPAFGSLLAACTILIRWYALASLHDLRVVLAGIVAHELAAAGAVALAWLARPADAEADRRLVGLNSASAVIVFMQAAIVVAFTGVRLALILTLVAYLVVRLILAFVNWRYHGVRWSDLNATFVLLSTVALAALSLQYGARIASR